MIPNLCSSPCFCRWAILCGSHGGLAEASSVFNPSSWENSRTQLHPICQLFVFFFFLFAIRGSAVASKSSIFVCLFVAIDTKNLTFVLCSWFALFAKTLRQTIFSDHCKAPSSVFSTIGNCNFCSFHKHLPLYSRNLKWVLLWQGISSSRNLLAEEAPISSPLTPLLTSSTAKAEEHNQKSLTKPSTVQAVLKGIKQVFDMACLLYC